MSLKKSTWHIPKGKEEDSQDGYQSDETISVDDDLEEEFSKHLESIESRLSALEECIKTWKSQHTQCSVSLTQPPHLAVKTGTTPSSKMGPFN